MKLYHATYTKNITSIAANGLRPCNKHNWYGYDLEDKVFLAFDPEVAEDYLTVADAYDGCSVSILEIDTKDIDIDKIEYDWNNRCEKEADINSIAYKGIIKTFHIMQDGDLISIRQPVQFVDLEHGDEDAQRIYWMIADVFDEQVTSNIKNS